MTQIRGANATWRVAHVCEIEESVLTEDRRQSARGRFNPDDTPAHPPRACTLAKGASDVAVDVAVIHVHARERERAL